MDGEPQRIGPQPGPQTTFLATPADIAIYGGAAGGGKTFGLLLEPLRHSANPEFAAMFFRRTTVQIRNPGGLWDESEKLYPLCGAIGTSYNLEWEFPSGAKLKMGHLEHEKTRLEYQGAQIPLILFDELTHFSETVFFYMLSRNRSTSGVPGYIRASCNPDPDSWVAKFIAYWIDQESGYPIPARAGKLRWMVRINDKIEWADTREELLERFKDYPPEDVLPKSVTFIPAKLSDNPALTSKDPSYRANLLALPLVEREQLLGGNWKIKPAAGLLFQRAWCKIVDAIPAGTKFKRGWDLAGTPKTEHNDPDWTSGTKTGLQPNGRYIVADSRRMRGSPGDVETFVINTASHDSRDTDVELPQDPAQAGKWQVQSYVKALAGYTIHWSPESGDKATRFGPFSSQAQAGNVDILRGAWNEEWFEELERFDGLGASKDDQADSTSRAFNGFFGIVPGQGLHDMAAADNAARAKAAADAAKPPEPTYATGSVEAMMAAIR